MKWQHQQKRFEQMLAYMLGRRPDEFGLVLDGDGYVGVKALLRALNEESGLGHIRRQQIQQLVALQQDAAIELDAHRIRSRERSGLVQPTLNDELPGLLYCCVRQRAYSAAVEKGVQRTAEARVVLSADQAMALRLGKRKDNQAVLLTVHTGLAQAQGAQFYQYGCLYLVDALPPGTFNGPPLAAERTNETRKPPEPPAKPKTPGSFTLAPPQSSSKKPRRDAGGTGDADGSDRSQSQKRRNKSKKWSREVPPWKQ